MRKNLSGCYEKSVTVLKCTKVVMLISGGSVIKGAYPI